MCFIKDLKFKILHADVLPSMQEASLVCTIDEQSFYIFTKNAWIYNLDASCHIITYYTELYNVTDINEQGKLRQYVFYKQTKLDFKVRQVDGSKGFTLNDP